MNPADNDRPDLLNELFPASAQLRVESDDVLQWVRQARAAREHRWRRCGVAALMAAPLAMLSAMIIFPSWPASPREKSAAVANLAPTSIIAHAGQLPSVEKVDDDHLLRLLDETPAALVHWPDGRRSLLVVVKNPTN